MATELNGYLAPGSVQRSADLMSSVPAGLAPLSPGVQGSDGYIFLVEKRQLLIDCCAGREGSGKHSRDLETEIQ